MCVHADANTDASADVSDSWQATRTNARIAKAMETKSATAETGAHEDAHKQHRHTHTHTQAHTHTHAHNMLKYLSHLLAAGVGVAACVCVCACVALFALCTKCH